MELTKKKEYLFCFDSDGTVMDTMTIKHERCFGPDYIEVFGIEEGKEDILAHWLDVNLYAKTRGINRFQGLAEILVYSKKYGYEFPGSDEFIHWVETTPKFSVELLKEFKKTAKEQKTCELALIWSDKVNVDIKMLPPSMPFEGAEKTLLEISRSADLLGVSSANKAAVDEEWKRIGIHDLFSYVACQDAGSKEAIIREALKAGYDPEKVVMVGDALGDLEAARRNGVHYFPILPGHEKESWSSIIERALTPMLEGRYDESYQAKLDEEFLASLK